MPAAGREPRRPFPWAAALALGALAALPSRGAAYTVGPDKRLTYQEARDIVARLRRDGVSDSERAALQRFINREGDRFLPGAQRELAKLAPRNQILKLEKRVREAARDGSIDRGEALAAVRLAHRRGATPAERRALVREMAEARRRGARLEPGARDVLDGFRRAGGLNQRLPVRPGDDGNRVSHDGRGHIRWAVREGTRLIDGGGFERGEVVDRTVAINFGQRKTLLGRPHLYVIAARIKPSRGDKFAPERVYAASGWIPEAGVKSPRIREMPTIEAPAPAEEGAEPARRIDGGIRSLSGERSLGARALAQRLGCDARRSLRRCLEEKAIKVRPGVPRGLRLAAGDYLWRRGGVVNLCYNLPGSGGVATDTFRVGARFKAAGPQASVPLYLPSSSVRVGEMPFVYGHVEYEGGKKRYGWIARWALDHGD